MKINNLLLVRYKEWLYTLSYADSTIELSFRYVRDFFFYLKQQSLTELSQITPEVLAQYHQYLQHRQNRRQKGGLSQNYIISNINALKRLSRYLQQAEQFTLDIDLPLASPRQLPPKILSVEEVRSLYQACDHSLLGIRDRAILGLYYGCALRRNEGLQLNAKDVLITAGLLHIRKGKGSKERYVPISSGVREDLENYLYVVRQQLLKNSREPALLLSMQARRLSGNGLMLRIHQLAKTAGISAINLHMLRHSIATHLLNSGMPLEEVSHFLGHSSLESTQLYTHIDNEKI